MPDAVVVDAVRTPIGRHGGSLKDVRPDDLLATVLRALIERTGIDPALIEDVLVGCANQAGEDNRNVARMSLLIAGLPQEVGGQTINRLCGSGLQAVNSAAQAIQTGQGEVFMAGGVESMTRAPFVMPKSDTAFPRGNQTVYDSTLGWRMVNDRLAAMYEPISMGETAENVAERYGISREEQDRFALHSQQRAVAAQGNGTFDSEIVPVSVPQRRGEPITVDRDEHPRADTSLEKLAALPAAFRKNGTVTAGNSAGINDGACALLMMSADKAADLGFTPMGRIVTSAVAGVDPAYMGIGPVPASRKALTRAGLTVDEIELVELNEAFAAQSLACIRELEMDHQLVNVNGGAIALGHPLGCSGARIMTSLLHEMQRRDAHYGLATMCIGVGQGIATVVERTS
ncbi:MAG TPA: thiolase family protein [Chloroflexota bacterium]|nr:thiolase family protein [Chloroflexota bacterium]